MPQANEDVTIASLIYAHPHLFSNGHTKLLFLEPNKFLKERFSGAKKHALDLDGVRAM